MVGISWRNRPAFSTLLALVLMLAMALVACGDDDEGAAPTAAEAGGDEGDVEKYCDLALSLETVPEPEIDFESLSPEQQAEELKKFITAEVDPLVRQIEPVIPAEIRAEGQVLIAAVDKAKETGDFSAFEEDPKFAAAEAKVHAFDRENCGWQRVDVTGTEYKFEGVPSTLEAGATSFDLTNRGKEPHELAILRINDDVEESFADLLKLPEEEARQKTKSVGHTFADPGKAGYDVVNLEQGRYGLACFVPVGGGEEGPTHASQGMFVQFEVA